MAQEIYHRSNWGIASNEWGSTYLNADLTNELYKRAGYYENSWATDKILNKIGTKPSIILTPTAYEDGKLNSVKPKGGENLITYSEDFSEWSLGANSILTYVSDIVAPDGSLGVYRLQLPATNDTYILSNNFTSINPLSTSIYAKSTGSGNDDFNIYTGASNISDSKTATSEWQRFDYTADGSSMYIINVGDTFATDIYIWGAQAERGSKATAYIPTNGTAYKNADFDFTRGSSATRVNEKGLIQDVQILSDELVQNGDFEQVGSELVTNGGFDNWTNGIPDNWVFFGTQDANNFIEEYQGALRMVSDSSQLVAIKQDILTQNKFYKVTANLIVNSGGGMRFQLGANGTHHIYTSTQSIEFYAKCDGTNGDLQIIRQGATDVYLDNVSVKEVGQNWTFGTGWSIEDGKAIYTGTTNSDLAQSGILTSGKLYKLQYEVINSTLVNGIVKLSGTTASAQNVLSQTIGEHTLYFTADGTIPTSFNIRIVLNTSGQFEIDNISVIEITDDTDLPRINYTDGEGSLLLEPQSTNLITYSEDFSEWTPTNIVLTEDTIIAPDGTTTADKIAGTSVTLQHRVNFTSTNVSGATTFSFFAKSAEYTSCWARIGFSNAYFDLENGLTSQGSGITSSIENYGNGWYRCIMTKASSSANEVCRINITTSYLGTSDFLGDNTSGIYLWGGQHEQLSYATSYIPTNGSAVTRLADVCNNSGNSDLINSTEGVLYAEIAALADDGTTRRLSISDGSNKNRIVLMYDTASNTIGFFVISNWSLSTIQTYLITDTTQFSKIAIKYKQNDFSLYLNGSKVLTDTSGTTPTGLKELAFDDGGGAANFYGNVRCVAVFKEALSDEELHKLTSPYESFEQRVKADGGDIESLNCIPRIYR